MQRPVLHIPKQRGPRENDVGYLISEARAAGLFVRQLEKHVELVSTKAQTVLFAGSVPQAVAFLQSR